MDDSQPRPVVFDEDNPEWTKADFAQARPGSEILPADFLDAVRQRGRPAGWTKLNAKQQVSLRLDPDIIDGFKAGGPGWQRRMNDALRAALKL